MRLIISQTTEAGNATCKSPRVRSLRVSSDNASAPASIDLLYEIRATRPDLFEKVEIMIDGGVRSGADVVKALALGAKAVGLGRPFLYANGTHGQEGVERVCESEC
jgi:isopentenyl diphosphate isomerase/L-lactate dehydrogenase-like FMN-dependent dehydrogenase